MGNQNIVQIYDLDGNPVRTIELPTVFDTPIRPDVIKRAVLSIQSRRIQPQGRDPLAGKRTSAESRGVGMGIARVPREKSGGGKAALAPGTVGGRQAHPPKSQKIIVKEITKKEKRLALCSAIAATASKEAVAARGHDVEGLSDFPLIVEESIESLTKTRDIEEVLTKLGLNSDLERSRESRKIRAGKGKRRGRKMKQAIGPLIVIEDNKGIIEAANNLPGVNVVPVADLNAEVLAPGTHPGRLTLWTINAINKLNKLCITEVVK